jgi:hydroxyacylglutathione hydrolase
MMLEGLDLIATPALGDNSFLLTSEGETVLVDPQRDAWRFLDLAEGRGSAVRFVLETHVHNDYVSGAQEIRAATGAEVVVPANGDCSFPHRAVAEGDEVQVGALRLVAMETPGHTPEHTSFAVFDGETETPVAIFTGGSLILGSAGRTDLLGDDRTDELTRAQFRSLRRLAALPDGTQILPTHGAGSFCASTPPSEQKTSTLGEQRTSNPALSEIDEERFVLRQLSGLLRYPAYYRHVAPINRAGAAVLGRLPGPAPLSAEDVSRRADDGAWIIDARDRMSFAGAHVPGSINVELDDSFASYVGWVIPFGARLVLVLPEPASDHALEAAAQLFRIGYERIDGYLAGGIEAWRGAGGSVRSYPAVGLERAIYAFDRKDVRLLDVRQPNEWEAGRIPGSLQIFVGDIPGRLHEVPRDRQVWTICASGRRAALAASLLDRARIAVGLVARDGIPEWLARSA